MSEDTIGSSVTSRIFSNCELPTACLNALLTSSTVTSFLRINVKSDNEPTGTGTRIARPVNMPSSSGNAFAAAIVAPVEVGTIFSAAALALR